MHFAVHQPAHHADHDNRRGIQETGKTRHRVVFGETQADEHEAAPGLRRAIKPLSPS
jgi:hypothetical protein